MNRVLITGGAGSVGREVALLLAEAGHGVRVLDLPGCDFTPLRGVPSIEIVEGSVEDVDLLRRAAVDVDAAIHLAALLPPRSEADRALTLAVNVGGTRHLVEALRQEAPDAHLILSSSVCVYGVTMGQESPISVEQPPAPIDIYGESKVASEEAVVASGLPYTVLRISGVSVPAFLAPPAVWPFMADQRIEFVARGDVVRALVNCVDKPGCRDRVLHVVGGPTWRMLGREYVVQFNDAMGLDADDAAYLDRPGTFDWYDTAESEAILGYQRASFPHFLQRLERAIEEALGG